MLQGDDMNTFCPFCKASVLGIQGNDVVIRPYQLHSSGGAQLDDVVGSVHSSCLKKSKYAQYYSSAMRAYVESVLRPRLLRDYEGGFAALLSNSGDWIVVFDNAFSVQLSPQQLGQATFDSSEMAVPCRSQINVNVRLRESDRTSLEHEFRHTGIALSHVLDLVGIPQSLCEHISVENALLRPYGDDPEASLEALQNNIVCGELTHVVRLPNDAGKLICPTLV